MKKMVSCLVLVVFPFFLTISCTSGLSQKVDRALSFFSSRYAFSHTEEFKLKDIHLDGVGLLNRDVLVRGSIIAVGEMGTFVVIEDSQIRMLIDTSHIPGMWENKKIVNGNDFVVVGKVQSSEKGHVYLTAKYIKAG